MSQTCSALALGKRIVVPNDIEKIQRINKDPVLLAEQVGMATMHPVQLRKSLEVLGPRFHSQKKFLQSKKVPDCHTFTEKAGPLKPYCELETMTRAEQSEFQGMLEKVRKEVAEQAEKREMEARRTVVRGLVRYNTSNISLESSMFENPENAL